MEEDKIQEGTLSHGLGFTELLRLATRIFTVKPARTVLTVLGTSVGIGTVVFLISLGYGLQSVLLGRLVTTEESLVSFDAFYPGESNLSITSREVEEIFALPEVDEVSSVAEFSGEVKSGDSSGLVIVRIIDDNYFRLSGLLPDVGKEVGSHRSGVVMSAQALKLISLPRDESVLGQKVDVKAFYQEQGQSLVEDVVVDAPLIIRGVFTDEAEPPIVVILDADMPKQPLFFKDVFVKAKDETVLSGLGDKLIDKGYIISARADVVQQARKVMNAITVVLGTFGVAALIVSAIGMFNTMIVGFLERIYEVGIMKALGATDRDIRNLFLTESMIMGLAGGIGGVLIGAGGARIFNFLLNIVAKRLGGKSIELFSTPLWFVFLVIGMSAAIGLIAGFWPARRATLLSPKAAFMKR